MNLNQIQILIPTFNNLSYLRIMLEQLKNYGLDNYLILDGGSKFKPMCDFLESMEKDGKVKILNENPGPRYFAEEKNFYNELPDLFVVTDPDIQFNKNLPLDFLDTLLAISEKHRVGKVGFALDISQSEDLKEETYLLAGTRLGIRDFEKRFWLNKIGQLSGNDYFSAPIDTTFALYNKAYFNPTESFENAIRVGGDFTSKHLPWYVKDLRSIEEARFYKLHNNSGAYHELDGLHLRLIQDYQNLLDSFSWRITKPLRAIGRLISIIRNIR
jgi:hypothetical protein